MGFATGLHACCNALGSEDIWVPQVETFKALSDSDRKVLAGWLATAAARGIDAAVDLSNRPWSIPATPVIVGVFEAHNQRASWLAVRLEAEWTLIRCEDGSILEASASLPDVLRLIDLDAWKGAISRTHDAAAARRGRRPDRASRRSRGGAACDKA